MLISDAECRPEYLSRVQIKHELFHSVVNTLESREKKSTKSCKWQNNILTEILWIRGIASKLLRRGTRAVSEESHF